MLWKIGVFGCTTQVEHDIKADSRPIKQRLYRVNHLVREHTDKKLVEVLKLCVVEPSSSTWSSPILFVKQNDVKFRFCMNYHKLNSVTVRDSNPLPQVSEILDKFRNPKYISSLDVKSVYCLCRFFSAIYCFPSSK